MPNIVNNVNDKVYNTLDKTLAFLQDNLNTTSNTNLPKSLANSYWKIEALDNDLTKLPLPILEATISDAIEWIKAYKLLGNSVDKESHNNLANVANAILFQAQLLCPVITGHLRDSGYVKRISNGYRVGFSASYAIYVHENLAVKHPIHRFGRDCGGMAKFLEIAATQILQRSISIQFDKEEGIYVEVV